jgi:hypothetical protein
LLRDSPDRLATHQQSHSDIVDKLLVNDAARIRFVETANLLLRHTSRPRDWSVWFRHCQLRPMCQRSGQSGTRPIRANSSPQDRSLYLSSLDCHNSDRCNVVVTGEHASAAQALSFLIAISLLRGGKPRHRIDASPSSQQSFPSRHLLVLPISLTKTPAPQSQITISEIRFPSTRATCDRWHWAAAPSRPAVPSFG